MSRKRKNTKYANAVARAAEALVKDRFDHYLTDIGYRIDELRSLAARAGGPGGGPVFAQDLNIMGRAYLAGFTITNNSPTAGSIAWADLHVVYNGDDHTITPGNSNNKYLWWNPATPTVMQVTNVKPVLTEGQVLLFMNNAGTAINMVSDTNASLPRQVGNDAVDEGGIVANAVTGVKLKDGAVTELKIGPQAVTDTRLKDGAVTTLKIGQNAVDDTRLKDGAVTNLKIGNGAVTDLKLGDGAVTNLKLGNGAVTSLKLDDAAVTPTKMNVLRHFIF